MVFVIIPPSLNENIHYYYYYYYYYMLGPAHVILLSALSPKFEFGDRGLDLDKGLTI